VPSDALHYPEHLDLRRMPRSSILTLQISVKEPVGTVPSYQVIAHGLKTSLYCSSVPRSCATVATDLNEFPKPDPLFPTTMLVVTVVVSVKKRLSQDPQSLDRISTAIKHCKGLGKGPLRWTRSLTGAQSRPQLSEQDAVACFLVYWCTQ
jgi:hypothetical protein